MAENIVIVNEKDEVIGCKSRENVDREGLIYRVSALWIKNSKGESLLARRARTKTHSPGMWGPAVAGTVAEGESYEDNIIKEAKEELGVENVSFEAGPKEFVNEKHKYFAQWFSCLIDKPVEYFKIQEEEVDEVKWFSKEEFEEQTTKFPEEFISGMVDKFKLFSP